MNTGDILNMSVKVCTRKSGLQQVNFLRYLTQPGFTIQITFKLTDIYYDQMKD